jgi:dimeric dUTPase (all-alpha-NTP-PPase superfamily)
MWLYSYRPPPSLLYRRSPNQVSESAPASILMSAGHTKNQSQPVRHFSYPAAAPARYHSSIPAPELPPILLDSNSVPRNRLPVDKPDQLQELFRMQRALNQRIGVNTDAMSDEEKTKWILNYCRAMTQEIAELTDSVPWKWWAKYQNFDQQNARVEVVDLFHFLISAAQVLGMSADDVFNAYVKKNEVNFKRQESGYIEKDHQDSKHI